MKLSRILLILGAFNNIVSYLIIQEVNGVRTYGVGIFYIYNAFLIFWGLIFLLAIVFIFFFRNSLPDPMSLRILGFFLCTPILTISYFYGPQLLKNDEAYNPPPVIEQQDETVWKYDRVNGMGGAAYAETFYKAEQSELVKYGDHAFQKDSVWTYYDDQHKILKTEYYKDGVLIKTIKGPASK